MKKTISIIIGTLALLIICFFALNFPIYSKKQARVSSAYKEATYYIDGANVILGEDGTQYFGNELNTDLDADGREDIAFLVTKSPGGSGTFFYVVGALNTKHGYLGTEGYPLGDRIAPQSITPSQNPRHRSVIVANYADRAPGEPMSARPSVGKSAYLKLDPDSLRWAIVEADFEGESR